MYPVWYGMTSGKIANIMNHYLELHKNRYHLRLYSQLCTKNSPNHEYDNTYIQNGFLSNRMKIYKELKLANDPRGSFRGRACFSLYLSVITMSRHIIDCISFYSRAYQQILIPMNDFPCRVLVCTITPRFMAPPAMTSLFE